MKKNSAIPLPNKSLLNRRYRIVRKLAQGGFGITYLAEDSRGERYVVKEHFPTWFSYREKSGGRIIPVQGEEARYAGSMHDFHREAMQLSVLNHPNIVRLVDAFEENGTAYYVMPYLTEGDLAYVTRTMHEKQSFLSQAALLQLLRTLLLALDHMHSRSLHNNTIYHFDLKPANVMLRYTEDRFDVVPVLIDFGAPGIGTPGYLPHEQRDSSDIGPWCDVYALAATMYKLLTNVAPPSHLGDDFEPLHQAPPRMYLSENPELCARYDFDILDSIDRALEWNPADRFQSAAQWYDAIKGIPVKFMDNGAKLFDFVRKEKESSSALAIAGGVAVFFTVLLAALVYVFFVDDSADSSSDTPFAESEYASGEASPRSPDEPEVETLSSHLEKQPHDQLSEEEMRKGQKLGCYACGKAIKRLDAVRNHRCPEPDDREALEKGAALGCEHCTEQLERLEQEEATRKAAEEEAARKAAEEEAARKAAEEEAARKAAEEEAARKAAEEEAARKAAEEEAARKAAEEEAARKAAEEEAARKAEEEEAARKAAEEEAARKAAEEETARKAAEEETARKAAEEEAARKAAEEEAARKAAEEEAKRKAEEDAARKKKEDAARKKKEEEARRKKAEAARKKKEEEAPKPKPGRVAGHSCPSNSAVQSAIRGSATHRALIKGANSGCSKCRVNLNWWNSKH